MKKFLFFEKRMAAREVAAAASIINEQIVTRVWEVNPRTIQMLSPVPLESFSFEDWQESLRALKSLQGYSQIGLWKWSYLGNSEILVLLSRVAQSEFQPALLEQANLAIKLPTYMLGQLAYDVTH